MDYQEIINQIAIIVKYCMPISILIGLIERLVRMIVRAATGKEN